jgi:hypothetical protein
MNDIHDTANQLAENQQLSMALMQMPESDIGRLLDTIKALQVDLLRLIPLFDGKEPVEAVTYTQDLLSILSDQINQVLTVKWAVGVQGRSPNLDDENASVDYAPVHRLLSKTQVNKRRLIWAGVD